MFATLANLNKRFAVFRAVSILFIFSLLLTTIVDTHVHAAHAGHEHNPHISSAHDHDLLNDVEHAEEHTHSNNQDVDPQAKSEHDQNAMTDLGDCCVLMLPTNSTIDFSVLVHSKYVVSASKLHSRRPDGLKRPPRHSA